MKDLLFSNPSGLIQLKSADKQYGLRVHSHNPQFVIIDVPGDKFVFDNFDDTLAHAKKDGYEVPQNELTNFLIEIVLKRKDLKEFNLGIFNLFKEMTNPKVLSTIQKYGIDSRQTRAVLLLYKD